MRAEFVFFGKRINMAPRARRRWLVGFIYSGFAALMAGFWFVDRWEATGVLILGAHAVNRFLLGGYYPGGLIKPFDNKEPFFHETPHDPHWLSLVLLLPPSPDKLRYRNDEREFLQRDHAHFIAYKILAGTLYLLVFLLFLANQPAFGVLYFPVPIFVPFGVALAGWFVSQTLPQAILLWTEPDMESEAQSPAA
jgi:uncharacterized integral membrane protein